MYDLMKEEPRYLVDYKSYLSAIEEMKTTAESLNSTHANDVFIVAIEEFQEKLMKRKEAKAKVKEYLAQKEAQEEADIKKRLNGAVLEKHPFFEEVSAEKWNDILEKSKERMLRLDEMEDGDEAKALLFFLTRNMSVLSCYVGVEGCEKMVDVITVCLKDAMGGCLARC